MTIAIECKNLTRIYRSAGRFRNPQRDVLALDRVSFEVPKGMLLGYIGPNGAGKTTTIKILTTILMPTGGEARVLGHDVVREANRVRRKISFIFGGERGLYWRLSGRDNLRYFGALYGVDRRVLKRRIGELLELVDLKEWANEKVETYSKGMKQRLHVARGLINDAEILFMDEPTVGLDPVGAHELRDIIRNLRDLGKTIMLTTHYMFEADVLCDQVIVIDHGRIVARGTPADIKKHARDVTILELEAFGASEETIEALRKLSDVAAVNVQVQEQAQRLRIQSKRGSEVLQPVMSVLEGTKVGSVAIREPTLEDAYLYLVGK